MQNLCDYLVCQDGRRTPGATTEMMGRSSIQMERVHTGRNLPVSELFIFYYLTKADIMLSLVCNVIGCGVDYTLGSAFFTRDGVFLGLSPLSLKHYDN